MSQGVEILPDVITAAGYAVGAVSHQIITRKTARESQAVIGAWAAPEYGDQSPTDPIDAEKQSRFMRSWNFVAHKVVRNALVPLGAMGAVAAGTTALAWMPHNSHNTVEPAVVDVIDHSFQAGLNGSVTENDTIAFGFLHSNNLNVKAIVAHNGSYDATSLRSITDAKYSPYGPPSMEVALPVAMTDAFDNSVVAESNVPGTGGRRSAGILVETDDHPIGTVASVVAAAKGDGDLPIFIVNTGATNNQVASDLNKIANETGGQYWVGNKHNLASVASIVKADITPNKVSVPSTATYDDLLKLLSGLSIIGFAGMAAYQADFKVRHKK